MKPAAVSATSADKILTAATALFMLKHFNDVSIKEIAQKSGVNSALISYYFGGKKNLYQEVLNEQSKLFLDLIHSINSKTIAPLAKLREYIAAVAKIQQSQPHRIHLVYRELLTPTVLGDNFIKNRLYKIHQFLAELVAAAIADGSLNPGVQPTHIAFTLESIIVFFFLTHDQVRTLENLPDGNEYAYLDAALNTYLASLSKQNRRSQRV